MDLFRTLIRFKKMLRNAVIAWQTHAKDNFY